MRRLYLIPLIVSLLFVFSSCCQKPAWLQAFHDQEVYRIIIIEKEYSFDGEYYLKDSTKTFETYNSKNQKIGLNNREFYLYDSTAKLIAKNICMDWCETPYVHKYIYNINGKLEKIIADSNNLVEYNIYDGNNHLIEKRKGEEPDLEIEYYTYNGNSIKCITEIIHNRFSEKISFRVDSLYYDINSRLIRREQRESEDNSIHVREMQYNDSGLVSMTIDTTINANEKYPYPNGLLYTSDYNKIKYFYNKEGKLIEKIMYQPDYQTPCCKYTYEYICKYK